MAKSLHFFKVFFLFVFAISICHHADAQISVMGTPYSFQNNEKSAVVLPELMLERIEPKKLIEQDQQDKIENRFSVGEVVNVDILGEGVQTQLSHGTIYQYKIEAEGAKSLGLLFENYRIPDGAELYVYNTDRTIILGAFTAENNKDSRILSLAQLDDDNLIIDYYEPKNADFKGELFLGKVFKAYLDFTSIVAATTDLIGINCTEGDAWQNEKRAVCRMLFYVGRDGYFCSGTLLNNTKNDCTPYFLTANHCISVESEANTLVTYFNYENSYCKYYYPDGDSLSRYRADYRNTLSGATLKAGYEATDVTLLLLTEQPPNSYEPYYAGWNVSGVNPAEGTCIHHPLGFPKCISSGNTIYSNATLIQWVDDDLSPTNSHWAIEFNSGATEQGSSGSGLFDENRRIVGQLHGGNDEVSYYGKLSLSWNNGLKEYLDPKGTNVSILDAIDYNIAPIADLSVETKYACLSSSVQLYDETRIEPDNWLWNIEPATFIYVDGTNASSQNPIVQFLTEGEYSISLFVQNEFGSDQIKYTNLVSVNRELDVHFSNITGVNEICGSDLTNYEFIATGAAVYNFEISDEELFEINTSDSVCSITLLDEYRRSGSFSFYVVVNGSHGDCSDADTVYVDAIIPSNDYIENAAMLNFGANTGYTNICGSAEDNEPQPSTGGCTTEDRWCSDYPLLNNTVWFKFVGPSSGVVSIETSGFDTQIAVYKAEENYQLNTDSTKSYEFIAAIDNPISSVQEAALEDLAVEPGKLYWLQVDGNYGATGNLSVNLLSNSLEVKPNPADNLAYVTFASKQEAAVDFEIFNISGNKLLNTDLNVQVDNNTYLIDTSLIPSGIYFLKATINGETFLKKIEVQH